MRPIKILPVMIVFLFLASFVNATGNAGDGTYKLYLLDTIKSSNDFVVELKNISYHYNQTKGIEIDSATYDVKRGGTLLSTLILGAGKSEMVSIESGNKNVTVTAVSFGSEIVVGAIAYVPPKYFATTKVESATYTPPPPIIDVAITGVSIYPSKFSALVNWTTNVSSYGKIYLYNKTSSSPMRTYTIAETATAHSYNSTGLKSDTDYSVIIQACTDLSCVNSTMRNFTTLPVTPVISNVEVEETTNDTATIYWETDVLSDAHVYYRVSGTSEWKMAPPNLPWAQISQFFIFNLSEPEKPARQAIVSLSENGGKSAYLALPSGSSSSISKATIVSSLPTEYSINSDLFALITDIGALSYIIKDTHTIKLSGLEANKTYQYKVSSCADRCVNSSVGTFRTDITIREPYANIVSAPSSVNHGTSAVLTLSAYGRNPGAKLTGVKVEYDDGGTRNVFPVFGGDSKSFVPGSFPTISVISITFVNPGSHQVTLTVTDNYSKTATDTVTINVGAKTKCTSTSAVYYPTDTPCTNKWPNSGGATIDYNNEIGACHAFEVCDDNLDFMVADAESCCNGLRAYSASPTKNRGYDYNKNDACDWAIWDTVNKGAMTSLGAESSMKMCKASYLVHGIGANAVYVKDYYTAETCCKDGSICGDYPRFQAWDPWPAANIKYNELWCYWYDAWIFGQYPRDGWYGSDTNPESNNNALADFPAHATVNVMNTGTCVDYSFVVTTSLRKAGFNKNEIMSMRTPGHLYNVVWLPGDTKYSFIDTVGNNGGDFFTGPGWDWESNGHRDHCGYNSNKCSNDNGMKNCPSKSNVWGC